MRGMGVPPVRRQSGGIGNMEQPTASLDGMVGGQVQHAPALTPPDSAAFGPCPTILAY